MKTAPNTDHNTRFSSKKASFSKRISKIGNKVLFSLVIICLCGAENNPLQDWKILELPNGWTITVPEGYVKEDIKGVDSNPGNIYSKEDKLNLFFDTGISANIYKKGNPPCSLKNETKEARRDLNQNGFKEVAKIPKVNRAYIDTVNGRIAIITVPKIIGKGFTGISIMDCKSQAWITITGEDLTVDSHNLVLKMFKTINH